MGLSIFPDTGEMVDRWLGIDETWQGRPPRYRHKTSYGRLLEVLPQNLNGFALAEELLNNITATWEAAQARTERRPSNENWRFEGRPLFDPENTSLETVLERHIVELAVNDNDWANQMPTASGLLNPYGRRCNVDLVQKADRAYSLFELKCASDTPLYAAIEGLGYGLLYLFSRLHSDVLNYNVQQKPILGASAIHLRVLAPQAYYRQQHDQLDQLSWLEKPISQGIAKLARKEIKKGLEMDFRFEAFPEGFRCDAVAEELRTALNARVAVCQ